jgi:plastocyanin
VIRRRSVALAALAALLLGAALLAGGAQPFGEARAATICAKHSKRVVKHVKRHGQRKRVVRIKHYRTCRPVAAPAPSGADAPPSAGEAPPASAQQQAPPVEPPPAPPTGSQPEPEPEPEANALGVAADDHGGVKSYTLSRGTVRSGRLTVQLQNKGEDAHDMEMQRVGPEGELVGEPVEIPETMPGEQKTLPVEVEPGEYRMWCNLYHHAEEGMRATITVE